MNGKNKFLFPFMLVTSLFFLWGMAHSMLDVLNKHFQEALSISKSASGLIQPAVSRIVRPQAMINKANRKKPKVRTSAAG